MNRKYFTQKIFTIFLLAIIFITNTLGQTPQKMSYQAIVRDATGKLISNHAVGTKISILQGSATGASSYSETQTVTSDANGLVSLAIGSGTIVSGSLSNIDWSIGPYFIKTETDPTGGASYTITGTSQILSVPYAIYAEKAGNGFSGNYNDLSNKPNLFDGNYNSLTNKPITDGSETKITAGTNITMTGTGTTASPYIINVTAHYIGESYGGGIVFYVYDNGLHGLIASIADQSYNIQWYNGANTTTNAVRDGIAAGLYNTGLIIANQGTGSYAAQLCTKYQGGNYGDWYLPSRYELNLLYLQKGVVGGFIDNAYWSSTENSSTLTYAQNYTSGAQGYDPKANIYGVRAIRAF